jgi:hypothetical protein
MAIFKTLRTKSKDYVFKYEGNEQLKEPARVVFARFPFPDENFFKPHADISYGDIDFKKVGKKDSKEVLRLFEAFIVSYFTDIRNIAAGIFTSVDFDAFLRECVEGFENLYAEDESGNKKDIKSVDNFLSLPSEAVYVIAKDLYQYANIRDEFSMGE